MAKRLLFTLGLLSLLPYLAALGLGDLRAHTVEFEVAFFAAFALYAAACALALRLKTFSRRDSLAAFVLTSVMGGLLVLARPTLSDDMYRYIWDGRVQAQGISPYRYPPEARELRSLREPIIWRYINRKNAVTIYPPAAELAYALLWRIVPDNVRWFQVVMFGGALAGGAALAGLLKAANQSPARIIIYLWSPLLIFETAHSAHVDGLVLPLLIGAWWARLKERDIWLGVWLGLATAMKLYPILLLPALWRPGDRRGRWQMPLTFGLTLAICYLPYILASGGGVLGFLPNYFNERFNLGLAGWLIPLFEKNQFNANRGLLLLSLGTLGCMSVYLILRSILGVAPTGLTAIRQSVWLMGAFTLLTQNLFSWYLLWFLPLIALFLQSGKVLGLRLDAWTGWWWFCGLVGLSYTFFITWRPVPWALAAQFWPLYAFLLIDLARRLANFKWQALTRASSLQVDSD